MVRSYQAGNRVARETYASQVRGCLLGGAIGDALGAPVEFWSLDRIRRDCGRYGVQELQAATFAGASGYGRITDDTQMTMFTVEGMIRASVRVDRGLGFSLDVLHHAYDRWLDTQSRGGPDGSRDGWLVEQKWLYSQRAPGATCLSALTDARAGKHELQQYGVAAHNNSKGCGAVMRSAPFGLLPPRALLPCHNPDRWLFADTFATSDELRRWQYNAACEAAGYTHGHPTGAVASGALAVLIGAIIHGQPLPDAVDITAQFLSSQDHHYETLHALHAAMEAAAHEPDATVMESLGGGWIAEEALAMAVYAALSYPESDEVLSALTLAVTHSGDSDSTGAICGNILGALHGETALPPALAYEVEGRGALLTLADDFIYEFTSAYDLHGEEGPHTRWSDRYPGW